MLDRYDIKERIDHIKKHGDSMGDVRDLAMLYLVHEHMEEMEEEHEHLLTREDAISWVEHMQGEDPAVPHGGKWTMEQVQPIAIKYGVQPGTKECVELWVAMNAMYSDYYGIAKKYNVLTLDYFADMAMAFIHDKDAGPDKLARYYKYIAKTTAR